MLTPAASPSASPGSSSSARTPIYKSPQFSPSGVSPTRIGADIFDQFPIYNINNTQYLILGDVGKGHHGKVVKSLRLTDGQIFAIKISTSCQSSEQEIGRNELSILLSLRQGKKAKPGIIQLEDWMDCSSTRIHSDLCATGCAIYLVMEYGESSILDVLEREKEQSKLAYQHRFAVRQDISNIKNDVNVVRFLWTSMCKCVAIIHSIPMIHGDLKPTNFVISKGVVTLIDFGTAVGASDLMTVEVGGKIYEGFESDRPRGSPAYMAPEIISTPRNQLILFTTAIDVWALGCILYELLFDSPLFNGSFTSLDFDPLQLRQHMEDLQISNDFNECLLACLEPSVERRVSIQSLLHFSLFVTV
jgi:serine/threonine protein kinase